MEKASNHRQTGDTPLKGKNSGSESVCFIGSSKAVQNIIKQVDDYAGDPICEPVLITGERGTGKELVAEMIHERWQSPKKREVFVHADCGTLHKETCHSTLFGHLKGSFTDAHRDHEGFFAEADGGTLFIDEIGNLIPSMQPLMLRVIQKKIFRKLGADKDETSHARLIFATNRSLDDLYSCENFMADLLDRLNRRHIHIPPLRERKEDIRVLADHFVDYFTKAFQLEHTIKISSEVYRMLENYDFPGNVRELEKLFSCAFLQLYHSREKVLCASHFQLPEVNTNRNEKTERLTEKEYREYIVGYVNAIVEANRDKWEGLPASMVPCLLNLDNCYNEIALSVLKTVLNKKSVAASLVGLSIERYRNNNPKGSEKRNLGRVKHFRRKKT